MERYRIGEFARKLGVTPDFLKYCESKGIITPQVEKNGYRYYGFTQAARLLEYMKCRNLGMSADEIRGILHGASYEEVSAVLQSKRQALMRQHAFGAELLRYYEELEALGECFAHAPDWQVRRREGFYFLPHSIEHNFIEGAETEKAVRAWNAYLPVVQSALCIRRDAQTGWLKAELGENIWGLCIGEAAAKRLGLPVDGPVRHVPAGRYLEVFCVRDMKDIDLSHAYERDVMERNGLKLTGDGYSKVVFKLQEDGVRREYSVLCLPIDR